MYHPHLVPLPFPLLGLCLKVVPLLLPTGSSTRKVPSVRHVINSMKNLKKKGFKLNDGIFFPAQIPRRFFKSDCQLLPTSSMSVYEGLVFVLVFAWLLVIWETWTSLDQNHSAEKRKKPRRSSQASGWTRRTCMQNFTGYLLKLAWTFRLLRRKHEHFAQ